MVTNRALLAMSASPSLASHSAALGSVALSTVITVRASRHSPEYSEPRPLYSSSIGTPARSQRSQSGLHGVQKVSSLSISHLEVTGGRSVSSVKVIVSSSPSPYVESRSSGSRMVADSTIGPA